ncbi:LamG domain-containing protein [Candidatus Gottesmanbacteria bacterium]|nr:LamG domain-containing protein [Candidatus Gottesmanbacteria bacterium]
MDETGDGSGVTVTDAAGNANGTTTGTSPNPSGIIGGARNVGGANYVNISNPAFFNFGTAVTITGWIKMNSYPSGNNVGFIFNKAVFGLEDKALIIEGRGGDQGKLGSYLDNTFGGTGLYSTVVMPLNTWTFVALTYNGSQAINYVKNASQNNTVSRAAAGDVNDSTGRVFLGANPDRSDVGSTASFVIDEVGVWNRTLTAAEISSLYNSGSGLTCGSSPNYSLTVSKTGSGTVTSSPAGINCGSACNANYSSGTTVTLTATPDAGSSFTGWGGDCSGIGQCNLTINSNKTAIANFNLNIQSWFQTSGGDVYGQNVSNPYLPAGEYISN